MIKNMGDDDEVQFVKYVPGNSKNEVQFIKQVPSHPRNRMRRTIKNTPAKILVDRQVLEDIPYFNTNNKVNETDKNRRKEAIFDKTIKQLPPNNDQYYIKHDKNTDSFTMKKDQKRRPVKRKAAASVLAANKIKSKYAKRRKDENT